MKRPTGKVTKKAAVARVSRNPKFAAAPTKKPKLVAVPSRKPAVAKSSRPKAPRRGKNLLNRLSPEARRFTAYSRRRRAITLSVLAAFGSLLLLVLATMFTPLLAVEKISVTGANRIQVKALNKALAEQLGTPLPLISANKISDSLENFPLIESFSVISLPPHTLRIHIIERQPICIVSVGGVDYLYDPAGVRVGKASNSDKYPQLSIAGNPKGSREFEAAIDVLLALPNSIFLRVSSIDAKTKDQVTLRLRGNSGQRIIWGDGSQSVLKSKTLEALIKNQKRSDYVTFDVSSPTTPVVRYGKF